MTGIASYLAFWLGGVSIPHVYTPGGGGHGTGDTLQVSRGAVPGLSQPRGVHGTLGN